MNKKLKLLLLVIFTCVLGIQSVSAVLYVTDVCISADNNKNNAKNYLSNNGYTIIEKDLNGGSGGHYIFFGYKTSTDVNQSITGFVIMRTEDKNSMNYGDPKYRYTPVKYNGRNYYLAAYLGDFGSDECGNLNRGCGSSSANIYLYYTKDLKPNEKDKSPIYNMGISSSRDNATVLNVDGNPADFNLGASGDDIFLNYKNGYALTYYTTNNQIANFSSRFDQRQDIISNTMDNGVGTVLFSKPITGYPRCMFYDCQNLKRVVHPNSLVNCGDRAFHGCPNFENPYIPEGQTSVTDYCFDGCTGAKGDLVLPSTLKTIGESAFKNNGFTGNLIIKSEVLTGIDSYAFQNVKFTGTVTFPKTLESFGTYTFVGASDNFSVVLKSIPCYLISAFDSKAKVFFDLDDESYYSIKAVGMVNNSDAQFTRKNSSEWGTAIIPFETQSTDQVQLYKIREISGNKVIIQKTDKATARQPFIYHKLTSAKDVVFKRSKNTYLACIEKDTFSDECTDNASITGTLKKKENVQNKFYLDGKKLVKKSSATVNPYTAWFDLNIQASSIDIVLFEEFGQISLAKDEYAYTGEEIHPIINSLSIGENSQLSEGIDYMVSYSDNINLGTGKVTVKFINRYKNIASASASFSIYCDHTLGKGNDATANADGNTHSTICKVCKTTVDMAHEWGEYKLDGDQSCTEDGHKTAKCKYCSATNTIEAEGAKLDHLFEEYYYNNDATEEADGTETAQCAHGCGKTDTRKAENTQLPTALPSVENDTHSTTRKYIKDGKIIIVRDGIKYDITGRKVN